MWSTCFIAATFSFFNTFNAHRRFIFLLYAFSTFAKFPIPTTSYISKSFIFDLYFYIYIEELGNAEFGSSSFLFLFFIIELLSYSDFIDIEFYNLRYFSSYYLNLLFFS
jgi:hypothetical protein